jgi:hypothetical protein
MTASSERCCTERLPGRDTVKACAVWATPKIRRAGPRLPRFLVPGQEESKIPPYLCKTLIYEGHKQDAYAAAIALVAGVQLKLFTRKQRRPHHLMPAASKAGGT